MQCNNVINKPLLTVLIKIIYTLVVVGRASYIKCAWGHPKDEDMSLSQLQRFII